MNEYLLLEKIKKQKPLVHHITNWVTIYDCAQIVKSFGASPVMAHAINEASDMASISSAVVLNIGTLTDSIVESMIAAGKAANIKKTPVVLDVCGAGATEYRNNACIELLSKVKIDIIKGNASEISKVAGLNVHTKGVDSGNAAESTAELTEIAVGLSRQMKSTVVITGKDDIVTDGDTIYIISNGSELMTAVVGTGCMAASVIGTFAAVENDYAKAAAAGLICYEVAAEKAAIKTKRPMEFKNQLFDEAFELTEENINSLKKIRISRK